MSNQDPLFNKLSLKFDEDVLTLLKYEKIESKLSIIRHNSRSIITNLINTALLQGDITIELKLSLFISNELLNINEYLLSKEVFEIVLDNSLKLTNKTQMLYNQIEAIQGIVLCDYKILKLNEKSNNNSMIISKYLKCLTKLRNCLDLIFELSTKLQEENSYRVLNICKLIYEIGQPLIYFSCGKYIIESFLFAANSMENIINLCTIRHLKFRLKLYNSAFYSLLSLLMLKEANNILIHTTEQINKITDRENLDPPIPINIQEILSLANDDIIIMNYTFLFFQNCDDIIIKKILDYDNNKFGLFSKMNNMTFVEKILCEIIHIHHLTAGSANETWKKRSNYIIKLFYQYNEKLIIENTKLINDTMQQTELINHENNNNNNNNKIKKNGFSISTLSEIALLILFDPMDANLLPIDNVLQQLWNQVEIFKENIENGFDNEMIGSKSTKISTFYKLLTNELYHSTNENLPPQYSMNDWQLKELDILKNMLEIISLIDTPIGIINTNTIDNNTIYTGTNNDINNISSDTTINMNTIINATNNNTNTTTTNNNVSKLIISSKNIIDKIEEIIYNDHEHRRQHYLQRIVICIWSRVLYPRLQNILSLDCYPLIDSKKVKINNVSSIVALNEIAPLLLIIIRILDLTQIEDGILLSSLAVIAGLVYRHIGDYRTGLSILKQSLNTLDNYRASRVDVSLHLPDDKRDVLALQRLSFSTSNDENDWYYSMKRLGARAYAGYGIFGAGSMTDRTDQALAEINVDMLSLYFRLELEYNLKHTIDKQKINKNNHINNYHNTSTTTTTLKNNKSNSNLSKTSSATKVGTLLTSSITLDKDIIVIEDLPCVKGLKIMCNKNLYSKALLYIEICRLETTGIEETRINLLKIIKECIEEIENNESLLKKNFEILDIIRNPIDGNLHNHLHYPIILGRTHKCIYVAPVGNRLTQKKASYYRIYAKEEGSGTAISLSNDDFEGCEKIIKVNELNSPSNGLVCIKGLIVGERYVFGSAAFNQEHEIIGQISNTTIGIDAVNPLPTIMLWTILAELSQDLGIMNIAKYSSLHVCNRYFDNPPEFETISLGKGINLSTDPHLCMLAIQQSSPVLLRYFIRSFLINEAPTYDRQIGSGIIHWDMKRIEQEKIITILRRIALVIMIASYIHSHELIVRCICLGYAYLCYLTEYDEINMAPYIQQPLILYISILQRIPKRHWRSLEHHLYCRLLSHVIKSSLINHNTLVISTLLTQLYNEYNSINAEDNITKNLSEEILYTYLGMISSLKLNNDLLLTINIQNQIKDLFIPYDKQLTGWKLNTSQLTYLIYGKVLSIVNGSLPELEQQLRIISDKGSQILNLLVQFLTELRLQLTIHGTIRTNILTLCNKIMNNYSIVENLILPKVKELIIEWNLMYLKILPDNNNNNNNNNISSNISSESPSRLDTPHNNRRRKLDLEEEKLQLKALGTLSYLISIIYYENSNVRQHSPLNIIGPYALILPTDNTGIHNNNNNNNNDNVVNSTNIIDNKLNNNINNLIRHNVELHTTVKDYVRYLCASLTFFVESNCISMAITSSISLWNFLVDEFQDPKTFAIEFHNEKKYLHRACEELVKLLESLVGEINENEIVDDTLNNVSKKLLNEDDISSQSSTFNYIKTSICPPRDIKEYLFLCRDFLIFLIKVLWILEDFNDVVEIGNRVLNIYMNPQGIEYCKPFDKCLSLIIHAQEQLLNQAQIKLDHRKKDLELFVTDYEEQQRKKRKKKVRIARLEKDESELKFEADKSLLEEKIYRADLMMKTCTTKLESLLTKQKKFDALSSTSTQLLDKLRKGREEVYIECIKEVGIDGNFNICLKIKHIREKIDNVFYNFNHVCHLLREKKDKITLIEALKEQGDLYLLVGNIDDARNIWRDAVDGLFNVMDTYKQWKLVVDNIIKNPDRVIIEGTLPIIVILGKLSKFTSMNDWDSKASYCRMAAELSKIPFMDSYGHPVSTTYGFSGYICRQLGGINPFVANTDKLSIVGLHDSFNEIIQVLFEEGCFLECLPIIVLWEHLHSNYTRRVDYWFIARLWRLKILITLHLFSQAAAMLANISSSIPCILQGIFHNPLLQPNISLNSSHSNMNTSNISNNKQQEYDTKSNGFDCYGNPPFYSHLPPHHIDNITCLKWISNYDTIFIKDIVPLYRYCVPLQKQQIDEYNIALEKYNNDLIKYNESIPTIVPKGKTAVPTLPEPIKPLLPVGKSTSLFSNLLIGELQYVCGLFLYEIINLDYRLTNSYFNDINWLLSDSNKLFLNSLESISHCIKLNDIKESNESLYENMTLTEKLEVINENIPNLFQSYLWTSLYSRCILQISKLFITRRNLRDARSILLNLLNKLQFNNNIILSADIKGIITQIWFHTKDLLIEIAFNQSRYNDVIKMSTQYCQETSLAFNGYWLRKFILHRLLAYYRIGNLDNAENDCNSLINLYKITFNLQDIGLIRCMIQKATILKEKIIYIGNSMSTVGKCMRQCIYWVKKATTICDILCRKLGGFTNGADANMSFNSPESVILKYDIFSPLIHSLNNIHSNDPPLSLYPLLNNNNKKIKNNLLLNQNQNQNQNWNTNNNINQIQRLGPIDSKEIYVTSPFANIYLYHMRILLICQNSFCQWLEEIRTSECMKYFESIPQQESFLLEYNNNNNNNNNNLDDELNNKNKEEEEYQYELSLIPMNNNDLLDMQSWIGEDALKVMRYVVYCPSCVRISLLLNVSKSRISKLLLNPSLFSNLNSNDTITSTTTNDNTNLIIQCNPDLFLLPLRISLDFGTNLPTATTTTTTTAATTTTTSNSILNTEISTVSGGGYHNWKLLNNICIEIVECYGNNRLQWQEDINYGTNRLKMACLYLIIACKLKNQLNIIMKSPLKLCTTTNSITVTTTTPTTNIMSEALTSVPLLNILEGYITTSSTSSYLNKHNNNSNNDINELNGPPGTNLPSGRDVICLLSTLLRECDPYWQDGYENNICNDLHHLLKLQYNTIYSNTCCILKNNLPNSSSDLSVYVGSIYTHWIKMNSIKSYERNNNNNNNNLSKNSSPIKSPLKSNINIYNESKSMYNWVTGYFLLGVTNSDSILIPTNASNKTTNNEITPEISGQPFLTKIILRRLDVLKLEQDFRDLRTKLAAAVINTSTGSNDSGNILGELLCRIISLINESNETGYDATYKLFDDTTNNTMHIQIISSNPNQSTCKLPLLDKTINLLSECFTDGTCVDGHIDSSICGYLRLALLGKI